MLSLLWMFACHEDVFVHDPKADCANLLVFADLDDDGYGAGEAVPACKESAGFVANADDCNDGDPLIAPGQTEVCDGVDQDCNSAVDDGVGHPWYPDADADGYGWRVEDPIFACEGPAGMVRDALDCDDTLNTVFPGADELCNDIDDDCDLEVDDDPADAPTWYRDNDGDGWGVPQPSIEACDQPNRSADNAGDCNDADPTLTDFCPAPPVPTGQAACNGGPVYTFTHVTGQPELHIVSVYEPTNTGRIEVWLQRPGAMTVLLSSYEAVEWVLNVDPAVTLHGVLVNGYDAQTLLGLPAGVPSQTRSYAQTGTNFGASCGYSWPYNGGGCDTNLLVAGVEAFVGQQTTGFVGCYTGEQFVIQ